MHSPPSDPDSWLPRIAAGRTDLVMPFVSSARTARASWQGVGLLAWCAHHGDVSAMRHLLAHGATLAELGDGFDLRGAAFHGHWQLCQFLLESGADANQADALTGETPLHTALCKANRPIYEHVIEVLLTAGADPDRPTRVGAPTEAFMRDCRTRGETPLHRAAAFGTECTIRMLLDAGARREARDAHGESPLSWASWHLRPPAILRSLCFGEHSIHPDNAATYDHGLGHSQLDAHARGRPRP